MTTQELPSRLHVLAQRTDEEAFEPDSVTDVPLVRFAAFMPRHRLSGWVRLRADRLTDLLNAHDELVLTDVEVEDLESGTTTIADETVVARRDLVAVVASGPRGDPSLRHRTRSHALAVRCGDFLVAGHLHVEPGVDPLASFRRRPPMVPLTDAWIERRLGTTRSRRGTGTIVVNRTVADWVRVVTDEELLDSEASLAIAGSPHGPERDARAAAVQSPAVSW